MATPNQAQMGINVQVNVQTAQPSAPPMQQPLLVGHGVPNMQAEAYGTFVPQQQIMGDPFGMLQGLKGAQVKERVNLIEVLTGIEMTNKYDIYSDSGTPLYFAGETTGCCEKNCIPPECRPFRMQMTHYVPQGAKMGVPVLSVNKDCQWTCCCLNRPEMQVYDHRGGKMGTLFNPFSVPCCCGLEVIVRDQTGKDVLKLHAEACQPGMCCQIPCGPCKEIHFDITDVHTQQKVGHMTHEVPNFCKWLCAPTVDNYDIEFGAVTDNRWKAILLAAAVFVDSRYFDANNNQQQQQNAGLVVDVVGAVLRAR